MCCRCCSTTQQKFWVFGLGTVLTIIGLVLILWWPTWVENKVYELLPLTPESRTFDKWVTTPIPIFIYFSLFNWTNPEEVRTANVKPHFEQLGPYVFREENIKKELVWHDNNTVTYQGQRTWFFEPELSGGTMEDNITGPHVPTLAASNAVRDESRVMKMFFNSALNRNGGALYQTHTASEWLFEGFYDQFLDFAMKLNNSLTGNVESNRFAWFLDRNDTTGFEGTFTIHTGKDDLSQMGEIKYWKGMNSTGFYTDECGKVNGSASDLWMPNRPADEYITVYITDTCRIINLVPTGETVFIEGIEGLKYETKPDTFDNGQQNPDMTCYCPESLRPDNCPKSGATYLGPCAEGAPMYLSHGNFMYADESYANTITGMDPSYERNNFFIIMQRSLGIPLQVNAVVQISLLIQADKDITILRDIPDFYAPLFVITSKAVMNTEVAKEVRFVLSLPSLGRYIGIGLLSAGVLMVVIGIILTMTRNWYRQSKKEVTTTGTS